MRTTLFPIAACLIALAGCRDSSAASFNPDDPAAVAAIDSVMQTAIAGARSANADQALKIAEGPAEFTFVSGDVMLAGHARIRDTFAKTYTTVKRQDQEILERKVRLIAPDVALYTAVAEGSYTTPSGWKSPLTGLGLTVVLVKRDGRWQAVHAHQSVAP